MKRLLLVSLILLFVLGVTTSCRSAHVESDDEYAVYSAYLESQILHNAHDYGRGDGTVLIQQSTSKQELAPEVLTRITQQLSGVNESTLSDFARSSRESTPLQRKFHLPTSYSIASESDINAGKARSDYGVVVFSQVGFSTTRSQALFHIDHFCGLCGGSGYVLMKKSIFGRWKIQNEYFTVVS